MPYRLQLYLLKKWLSNLRKKGELPDSMDIGSLLDLVDPKLTYQENKQIILSYLPLPKIDGSSRVLRKVDSWLEYYHRYAAIIATEYPWVHDIVITEIYNTLLDPKIVFYFINKLPSYVSKYKFNEDRFYSIYSHLHRLNRRYRVKHLPFKKNLREIENKLQENKIVILRRKEIRRKTGEHYLRFLKFVRAIFRTRVDGTYIVVFN